MKHSKKILPLLCVLTLASCGGSGGGGSGSKNGTDERQREEEVQNIEGTYKAILRPYNFTVSGWVPSGMGDIKVTGDEIEIKSWLDDSQNVTHMQNIHMGTVCPGAEHDINKDGFVDFNESTRVSGQVLLPLDSDLTSQDVSNVFPKGNFTYFQKASVSGIVASLQKNLNLEGKVIIVMGGAANRNLPGTVSTVNGMTKELSVPIACGVIQRHNTVTNN
jgi:hypothetical protein